MVDPKKISNPTLVQGPSMTIVLLQLLLSGIEIDLRIDGEYRKGRVVNLDLSPGSPHCFAKVAVKNKLDPENDIYILVSIDFEGRVEVMAHQLED